MLNYFVLPDVFASVFRTDLTRPFDACLSRVRHGPTVIAGPLTELGCCLLETFLMVVVDRGLIASFLTLVLKHRLATARGKIEWHIFNVFRHMC